MNDGEQKLPVPRVSGAITGNDRGARNLLAKIAAASYQVGLQHGDPELLYQRGLAYRGGRGVPQDSAEAFRLFMHSADRGHVGAQCRLAYCYWYGDGVTEDDASAAKWFGNAALHGDAEAQYRLAWCYTFGEGIEQDQDQADKWYRLAAQQGKTWTTLLADKLDQCEKRKIVSRAKRRGIITYQDLSELLPRTAKSEQIECLMNELSREGVEIIEREAASPSASFKWMQMVAKQGEAQAQLNVGDRYNHGDGVEQDHEKAFRWYLLAANQGERWAQFRLAECYEKGVGAEQDQAMAIHWISEAAEQGHSASIRALRRLNHDGSDGGIRPHGS